MAFVDHRVLWKKLWYAIYFVPYMVLIIVGAKIRYEAESFSFLYPDSNSYLLPAVFKKITGAWYLGDRPLQYIQFLYLTLSKGDYLKSTILIQQTLGLLGCLFLIKAWWVYTDSLSGRKIIYHMMGWFMMAIYATSPLLLFYEKLIEPEAISIFLMSVLIYGVVVAHSPDSSIKSKLIHLSLLIFLNLYLSNLMTKWVFAALFLELFFIYSIAKLPYFSKRVKAVAIALPLLLYFSLVVFPENEAVYMGKKYDRFYVELNQMVYTHYPLLIQDKSNFPVSTTVQDSLESYYRQSCLLLPNSLLGFSNDALMAGKANEDMMKYFNYNFDTLEKVFIQLNYTLATKYTLPLVKDIAKQFLAFYIPNKYVRKELYTPIDPCGSLQYSLPVAHSFDSWLRSTPNLLTSVKIDTSLLNTFYLEDKFSRITKKVCMQSSQPSISLFLKQNPFIRFFDYFFLACVVMLILLSVAAKTNHSIQLMHLFYIAVAIYVLTIAIVHTFDVQRFITTIYPFLLFPAFMVLAYLCHLMFKARELKQKVA